MIDLTDLMERYVAIWNEPDATRRRAQIETLWVPDGGHFTKTRDVRGYPALEARVGEAYEKFVADGSRIFRPWGEPDGHHDTVRLHWCMMPTDGGPTAALGFDFLVLAPDGRIQTDYQYVLPTPTA